MWQLLRDLAHGQRCSHTFSNWVADSWTMAVRTKDRWFRGLPRWEDLWRACTATEVSPVRLVIVALPLTAAKPCRAKLQWLGPCGRATETPHFPLRTLLAAPKEFRIDRSFFVPVVCAPTSCSWRNRFGQGRVLWVEPVIQVRHKQFAQRYCSPVAIGSQLHFGGMYVPTRSKL